MQKRKLAKEDSAVPSSPYRMGNWTVTMLKDELRSRQLPITGKKAELIDRLENSPIKTTAAPNLNSRDSPVKSIIQSRGRSRSPQPHAMMTRSRSNSLNRGTFLTWSRQPFAVFGNFILAQFQLFKENFMFFSALIGLILAISALLYFNENYKNIFVDQLTRVQPVLQVFVDGFLSNLGLNSSEFLQYISKASRFMYDCASGNIERNSATGRLRCSAATLKAVDFGLVGRLFWLTREQFLAWTAGTLTASLLVFLVSRKARTALPLKFFKFLNLAARFAFLFAALSPFEAVGLISGFAGFKGSKFALLLALKTFVALPLQFAFKVLVAKHQKLIAGLIPQVPMFDFSHLLLVRQILNIAFYSLILAAAVQVIANSHVYKKNI